MAKQELILKTSLGNFKVSRENLRLFLNSVEVIGVQNLQMNVPAPYNPVTYLGMHQTFPIIRGEAIGTVGVQSLLVNQDFFINYTGNSSVTGYIIGEQDAVANRNQNRIELAFTNSYLSSYSLSYSDGQIPEISTNFQSFSLLGNMTDSEYSAYAANTTIQNSNPNFDLTIPGRGSININLDSFATNRVLNFNLDFSISRTPVYAMGKISPVEVITKPPIGVSFGCEFELGDYDLINLKTILEQQVVKNIEIQVSGINVRSSISNYSLQNLSLVNQSFSANTNNNALVQLQFNGFVDL